MGTCAPHLQVLDELGGVPLRAAPHQLAVLEELVEMQVLQLREHTHDIVTKQVKINKLQLPNRLPTYLS